MVKSSFEIIKSGSTDSTEVMGSICDGQAGCSWDDSIADQIKDPCADVFKYMSVEYACAVPAPPQRQNDSGFTTNFTEVGGDCYNAMMATYNFYSNVLDTVADEESHGPKFYGETKRGGHQNRLAMFKFNMVRWGNKLDERNCECPIVYTSSINMAFNKNQITAGMEKVDSYLEEMANAFTCKGRNAVQRKVRHAHQIVKGSNPRGSGKINASRFNKFNQF